ncbi:MAG: hypothetical protein IT306_08605 [Chloroflexi bacterium]|nr:hypothetical protein [Chloroflexota bacterium]
MAALLLLGAPVLLAPTGIVMAAGDLALQGASVLSPAAGINNDDPDELCRSGNPRKQKKCRYNGWDNDNAWTTGGGPDARSIGSARSGLTVELWRSNEWPKANSNLTLAVKGDQAPISQVSWRAVGPTADDPAGDDMAHRGEQTYDCAGAVPCAFAWNVVPRYSGYYAVYAKVRDTSGNEAELVWKFTAD